MRFLDLTPHYSSSLAAISEAPQHRTRGIGYGMHPPSSVSTSASVRNHRRRHRISIPVGDEFMSADSRASLPHPVEGAANEAEVGTGAAQNLEPLEYPDHILERKLKLTLCGVEIGSSGTTRCGKHAPTVRSAPKRTQPIASARKCRHRCSVPSFRSTDAPQAAARRVGCSRSGGCCGPPS